MHSRPASRASRRTAAVVLDEGRLGIPAPRPGSVPRTGLVNRLRGSASRRVVSVLAPAGYGKTTVLAQWAERDLRPFAWVSVAPADRDPPLLAAHVEAALAGVGALEADDRSPEALARALLDLDEPVVLVLDDVHRLPAGRAAAFVVALAEHVQAGATLVLAGRSAPAGRLARLRASGELFELGADDLALTRREADLLLHGVGVELGEAELAALAERMEGWPAGIHLAALALMDERLAAAPAGADRFLADYFEHELLSPLGADDRRFLTRTAVLDRLGGPLCDAVLRSDGSVHRLESLAGAGLFLLPLDRSRSSFRYHREFRDFLRAELGRLEPRLAAGLNRRASAWCEATGDAEAAIAYAHAGGQTARLARLVEAHGPTAWASGRADEVETWLGWLEARVQLQRYPGVAVLASLSHALRGRTAEAVHRLALAEGSPEAAALRAAMCRDGVEEMQADAETARRELAPASAWLPTALHALGAVHVLRGEPELADAAVARAVDAAGGPGATPARIAALAERSLLAHELGDDGRSDELAVEARALVAEHGLAGDVRSALAFAASARRELRAGNLDLARSELERAAAVRPQLSTALPWLSVRAGLEAADVHLALLDLPGTRAWLRHSREVLRLRPALSALGARLGEIGARAKEIPDGEALGGPSLTPAELRLVPLLATHRSFREIGVVLHVSRNTVKTQAISIYRKLGVCSRGEAVERAAQIGLAGGGFTRTG